MENRIKVLIADSSEAFCGHLKNELQQLDGYDLVGTATDGEEAVRLLEQTKPDILVLDDSSSALDYKTDASLRQAIRENLQKTTSIIIAQRISSVMQADHILVLENGREIGYGTHEQLMQNCSVYQEIAGSQLGDGKLHTPNEKEVNP